MPEKKKLRSQRQIDFDVRHTERKLRALLKEEPCPCDNMREISKKASGRCPLSGYPSGYDIVLQCPDCGEQRKTYESANHIP